MTAHHDIELLLWRQVEEVGFLYSRVAATQVDGANLQAAPRGIGRASHMKTQTGKISIQLVARQDKIRWVLQARGHQGLTDSHGTLSS